MSIYIFLYIFVIVILLYLARLVFKKHIKYLYWKYLIVSILLLALWLSIYLISFTVNNDNSFLIYFSRALYTISLMVMYTMLFFVIYYIYPKFKIRKINYIVLIFSILLLVFYISTWYIVESMEFDYEKKYFIEKYWTFYNFYNLLYLVFSILFVYFSFFKLKNINWTIKRVRLLYISTWFFIFILLWIIFLWVLPSFWIRLFEKEQILFFIPFILSVWYSIHKYNFLKLHQFQIHPNFLIFL
jgi:hypothetical protein